MIDGIERSLQAEDLVSQPFGVATDVVAQLAGGLSQQLQVDAGREVLAVTGQHDDAHFVGLIDPAEDIDDLGPERGIHRVGLLWTIDRHMGDLVRQFDLEGLVFSHALIPDSSRHRGATQGSTPRQIQRRIAAQL